MSVILFPELPQAETQCTDQFNPVDKAVLRNGSASASAASFAAGTNRLSRTANSVAPAPSKRSVQNHLYRSAGRNSDFVPPGEKCINRRQRPRRPDEP